MQQRRVLEPFVYYRNDGPPPTMGSARDLGLGWEGRDRCVAGSACPLSPSWTLSTWINASHATYYNGDIAIAGQTAGLGVRTGLHALIVGRVGRAPYFGFWADDAHMGSWDLEGGTQAQDWRHLAFSHEAFVAAVAVRPGWEAAAEARLNSMVAHQWMGEQAQGPSEGSCGDSTTMPYHRISLETAKRVGLKFCLVLVRVRRVFLDGKCGETQTKSAILKLLSGAPIYVDLNNAVAVGVEQEGRIPLAVLGEIAELASGKQLLESLAAAQDAVGPFHAHDHPIYAMQYYICNAEGSVFSDFCIAPFARSDEDIASMAGGRALQVHPGPRQSAPRWFDYTPTEGPTVVPRKGEGELDAGAGAAAAPTSGVGDPAGSGPASGGAGSGAASSAIVGDALDRLVLEPWDAGPGQGWVPAIMAGGPRLLGHSFVGNWVRQLEEEEREEEVAGAAGHAPGMRREHTAFEADDVGTGERRARGDPFTFPCDSRYRVRPTVWVPTVVPAWRGMAPVRPPMGSKTVLAPVQLTPIVLNCMDHSGRGLVGQPAGGRDASFGDLIAAMNGGGAAGGPKEVDWAASACARLLVGSQSIEEKRLNARAARVLSDWMHRRLLGRSVGEAGTTDGATASCARMMMPVDAIARAHCVPPGDEFDYPAVTQARVQAVEDMARTVFVEACRPHMRCPRLLDELLALNYLHPASSTLLHAASQNASHDRFQMAPFVPPVVTVSRVSLFGGAAVLPRMTQRGRSVLLAVLAVRPYLQVGSMSNTADDGCGSGSSRGADPCGAVDGAGTDGSSSAGGSRSRAAPVPGFGAGAVGGAAAQDSTAQASSKGKDGTYMTGTRDAQSKQRISAVDTLPDSLREGAAAAVAASEALEARVAAVEAELGGVDLPVLSASGGTEALAGKQRAVLQSMLQVARARRAGAGVLESLAGQSAELVAALQADGMMRGVGASGDAMRGCYQSQLAVDGGNSRRAAGPGSVMPARVWFSVLPFLFEDVTVHR